MKEPLRICTHPGCRKLTDGGRCDEHKLKRYTNTTKNRSGDPFYGSAAWKRLRKAFLTEHPLCECDDCKRTGDCVAADRVDHIKPRCDYPELQLDWDNLRAMSESHHNRHTARTRLK